MLLWETPLLGESSGTPTLAFTGGQHTQQQRADALDLTSKAFLPADNSYAVLVYEAACIVLSLQESLFG